MKLYYISKIGDNTYDLSTITRGFEKTVTVDELAEVVKADTVVGFNALTGKTSVKTKEDAKAYLVSKCKLSGVEPPTFRSFIIDYATEDFDSRTETHRITISDKENNIYGYDYDCIYTDLSICYVAILQNLNILWGSRPCCKTPCKVQLVYDLQSYNGMSNMEYLQESSILKGIELTSVEFVNKDMFKHTDLINRFFRFVTEFEVSEDFCLDLSELEFKDKFRTHQLLCSNFANIKLSESFKRGEHDYIYDNTTVPRETILTLSECDNVHLGNWLTIGEMRYSDFVKHPNISKFISGISINTLVLDCNILQGEETKCRNTISNLRVEPEFKIDIDKEDYDTILSIMNTICYDYSPQLRVSTATSINNLISISTSFKQSTVEDILKRKVEDLKGTLKDIDVLTEQILPEIGKTLLIGEKYKRAIKMLLRFKTADTIRVFWDNSNIDDLKVLYFLFYKSQYNSCEFYIDKRGE